MQLLVATCAKLPNLTDDDHLLLAELAKRGVKCRIADWRDPAVDWKGADAVLIRTTWDYFKHVAELRAWLDRLDAESVRLINPSSVIRRNLDKRYLRDLAQAGVAILPATWVEQPSEIEARAAELDPAREYVIKPAISAGAFLTERMNGGAPRAAELLREIFASASGQGAMIQEFAPEIARDGEWSFLFAGGEFTHAVVKRSKPGDFRVQFTHGGSHEGTEPPAELLAQARRALELAQASVFPGVVYARVDGIARDGKLLLMELELFEPFLFLGECRPEPGRAAGAYADAIIKGISRTL